MIDIKQLNANKELKLIIKACIYVLVFPHVICSTFTHWLRFCHSNSWFFNLVHIIIEKFKIIINTSIRNKGIA